MFLLFLLLKRFPFDWENPLGYLIAIAVQYVVVAYECFAGACSLSLGIGLYWFVNSASKDFQRFLPSINDRADESPSNELKMLFIEFVDAHVIIKQLSIVAIQSPIETENIDIKIKFDFFRVINNFSDLFQPIVMMICTWSLLSISSAMLIIHEQMVEYIFLLFKMLPVSISIRWLLCFRISGASWECDAGISIAFRWHFWSILSIHLMWTWPKNQRFIWGNWLYYRTVRLVFISYRNKANVTSDHRDNTTTSWNGMLRKYHMQPRSV